MRHHIPINSYINTKSLKLYIGLLVASLKDCSYLCYIFRYIFVTYPGTCNNDIPLDRCMSVYTCVILYNCMYTQYACTILCLERSACRRSVMSL